MAGKNKGNKDGLSTEAFVETVMDMIACGHSVRSASKELGFCHTTFFHHIRGNDELRQAYLTAKTEGAHAILDQNEIDIAVLNSELRETITVQTETGPMDVPRFDGKRAQALVNHTKNVLDYRKWMVARMLPKTYGDKVVVEDGDGKAIPVVHLSIGPTPDKTE